MREYILALVSLIATEVGVPEGLAKAIVLVEGAWERPDIVSATHDFGIMQLNRDSMDYLVSRFWDKPGDFIWANYKPNLYVGLRYLRSLMDDPDIPNWWAATVAYNGGPTAFKRGQPPNTSLDYADKVSQWYNFQHNR